MPRTPLTTCALFFGLSLASMLAAQPYPDDFYFGKADFRQFWWGQAWRVRNGSPTQTYPWITSGLVMDAANTNAVASGPFGVAVLRPSGTFQVVSSLPASGVVDSQDGGFLLTSPYVVWHVDRWLATRRTLRSSGFRSLAGPVIRDLWTGDYLISDAWPGVGVFRMSRDGARLGTASTLELLGLAQSHLDGSLFGTLDPGQTLVRVAPGGRVTTIATGYYFTVSEVLFDRAPGRGEIVVGDNSGRVYRFTAGGIVTTAAYIASGGRAALCFARGRNLATEELATNNHWRFRASFPGEGGRGYVIGLSASGFTPGIAVGGRTVALVPDAMLHAGLTGVLGALWQNSAGRLDASGAANAILDLRRFGSVLRGVRLWACALTLDPQAPAGVRTISKPVVLVLE